MKKVLLVSIDGLGNGGVQSVMMNIVRSLSDKYCFDIIVFHKGKDHCFYEKEFQRYGNIYFINRDRSKHLLVRLFKYCTRPFYEYWMYKKIIANGNYDIIHCHNEEESALALKAAKKCGTKVRLSHSHNALDRSKQKGILSIYRNWLMRKISKYSTENIACSKMAGKSLFGENPFTTIYNPIDLTKFKPMPFSGDSNSLNIINVGRFCDQKNQFFLLKVFAEITKKINTARLTLIGYGPDEKKLRQFVADTNLNNVIFLPSDTNVANELIANDIFVLPSIYEGFPLSLIEAQVSGLKCFVSSFVTKEADLGYSTFLDLSDSEKQWATAIIDYWNNNHHKRIPIDSTKTSTYSIEYFSALICQSYENK